MINLVKLAMLRGVVFGIIFILAGPTVFSGERPNILLIVSEDNGPELGCYGDRYAQTPNLDRLANQGLCFLNAYVPQSGCSQSRASYLTGLYPHQHGQFGLATWGFRLYNENIPNLPNLLKNAGYRTGIIGKLHINPASAFSFDFKEIPSANFQRKDLQNYAAFAKQFITSGNEPFFLSVNYPEAHDPWLRQVDGLPRHPLDAEDIKPMAYMGVDSPALRELVADYYNCLSRLDTLVGDLLSVLDKSGKADDTIVIYLGDHGADMLRGKRTCYEGGLRIPMMIRWPGRIVRGTPPNFVSTIDLMPTLLTAIDLPLPHDLPGCALQPLFNHGKGQLEDREYLFAEYHTHAAAPNYFPQRSVRNHRFKLILSLLPNTPHPDYEDTVRKLQGDHSRRTSVHTLDVHQLIASAPPHTRKAYELMKQPPAVQLYDLRKDPYEFNNLANSTKHQKIRAQLLTELNQWRQDTADPLLNRSLLKQLTDEVQAIQNKNMAREHEWQYPHSFLRHLKQQQTSRPK